MISKKENRAKNIMQIIDMESLVPNNHLVRQIDRSIDFEFIRKIVKEYYSEDKGRPSIDPVILFKIIFIQYLFGIKSIRQTIREIEVNIAYRWFLGLDFTDTVPHYSTFSKNYERRFSDNNTFEEIFQEILGKINDLGLINKETIFIDSTHIKAYANKRKIEESIIEESKHLYINNLHNEINIVRKQEGHKEIDFKTSKKIVISRTDKECGMFHKGEKERQLAYSNQVACDNHGFIIDSEVYPGNLNDNNTGIEFTDKICQDDEVNSLVMDAGYTSPVMLNNVINKGKLPIIPYVRPKGKRLNSEIQRIARNRFVFDKEHNRYTCPMGKFLNYKGINCQGMLSFKSNKNDCIGCPLKNQCSNQKHKEIQRHLLEHAKEYCTEIRFSEYGKERYPKRKETIERVFALAKFNHNLGFTFLRGIKKNKDRSFIIFACLNLKKMAKMVWDSFAFIFKNTLNHCFLENY